MDSPRRALPVPALLVVGALLPLAMLLSGPLAAQERVPAPELREGAAFHRVVTVVVTTESPRGVTEGGVRLEADLRVVEVHEDGSGIFEVTPTVARQGPLGSDGRIESSDPEAAGAPDPMALVLDRTFRVPFLPGGAPDMAFFQDLAEDGEEQFLIASLLASLIGRQDRADGFLSGLPAVMEVGAAAEPVPFVLTGSPARAQYRLVGVEERDGRREGRVEISGESGEPEEPGDGPPITGSRVTGHLLLDLDRGAVIESILRVSLEMAMGSDTRQHHETEYRTVPVP